MHVTAGIVETACTTGPAGDLVEIEMPTSALASRTQEPRPLQFVPHDGNADVAEQNVGRLSGEAAAPVTPPDLRHDAVGRERAGTVERERAEPRPVLHETIGREVRGMLISEQAERA
ncbi:hypothetical protein GCM10007857_25420 [Bradyrhizobium iriomotense]|uniref:Uncharacterized protein n=1 Tax=Bradyrhizobium iriomotense TaxID=441950 RepID=A0ABQ6AX67_9BRAD|nr:hypothetical protein GCM10007857_25420 [Bradyrhizobium iriomotense]